MPRVSMDLNPVVTKKAKKAMQKQTTTAYGTTPTDVNDIAALHRRAQRFQREHELEKNKNIRNGSQTFLKTNHQTVNRFQNLALVSRSTSPTDEPEGDPVSPFSYSCYSWLILPRTLLIGIDSPLLEHRRSYSKIICG
jgi:hypothetical protein